MPELASLRVVTFNAWVLPIRIPTQEKRRRIRRLPEALAALGADVIVLQELFDVKARRLLLRELCPPYATTHDACDTRRVLGLVPADATGGLLVLSRLPIIGNRFIPHSLEGGKKIDERLAGKGAMLIRIETPVAPLTCVAVHLYAGTRPRDSRVRVAQLKRLLEMMNDKVGHDPVVLLGDINASPTAAYPEPPGPSNPYTPEYAALAGSGFIDPLPPNPTPGSSSATWVPSRNRYAALPYQETKTDERYDYLMVRPGRARTWKVRSARTVLDQKEDLLSDHFGVLADLELLRQEGLD